MTKNDINLIQRRKNGQYSFKSIMIAIGILVFVGVCVYLGITLPSKNLSETKAAVIRLEDQLQQFSGIALSAGGTNTDIDIPVNAGLDTIYMVKTKQLKSLEEQLESLKIISTAESNALAYIYAIEESTPEKVSLTSISMNEDNLSLNGTASGDTALAVFCLRLKETNMFSDVFVSSSMVIVPDDTTTIFNMTATLNEPLDSMPTEMLEEDPDSNRAQEVTQNEGI